MGLNEETYEALDKARKIIPNIDIRFIEDVCELYINGDCRFNSSGSEAHINASIDAILYGIILAGEQKSLKHTLKQL